jgi:hypothetical protein
MSPSESPIEVMKLDSGSLSFHSVENSARALHDLLGGFMEVVYLPYDNPFDGLIALVDDNGVAKGLPLNPYAFALVDKVIVGPMLIVRALREDFVSITQQDISVVTSRLLRVNA